MCKDAVYVCFIRLHRSDLIANVKDLGTDKQIAMDSIQGGLGGVYLLPVKHLEQFKFKDKVTEGGRLVKHLVSKI